MANRLRSAIYYPYSRITNLSTMRQALLLWDEYHIIAPYQGFEPRHSPEIAEAWSLIGRVTVPHRSEQRRAHDDILAFIRNPKQLNSKFFYTSRPTNSDVYDMYPDKLLGETWYELERAGLTGGLRDNRDRPLTPWGGLIIMAKLADACAGEVFARVTDRADAYRTIADEMSVDRTHVGNAVNTVPILLSMIDAQSIPLENIMRFRADEVDPSLRHKFLDSINDHIEALSQLESPNQVRAIQDQFEREMRRNLIDLRDALRWNKVRFVTSGAVLACLTGAFCAGSALQTGPLHIGPALATMAAVGLGVKELHSLFGSGLELSLKQKETLSKYPMAYMHTFSRYRIRT